MNSKFIKMRTRDDLGLVYFDIPKCASTAIKNAMFPEISDIGYDQGEKWEGDFSNNYSFTFIRCPYDRMVSNFSMYANWAEMSNSGKDTHLSVPTGSMDEFLKYALKNMHNNVHLVPQSRFIPKNHKLSFIGSVENAVEDWNFLQRIFKTLPDLEFWNVSKNRPNSKTVDDLTEEQKEIIEEAYADDFKLFMKN